MVIKMKIHKLSITSFERAFSDFIADMVYENKYYGNCKRDYTREEFKELSIYTDWYYDLDGKFIG